MSISETVEKFGAWFSKSLLPIAATIALILGAQVIWPRERIESLSAQQTRLDLRIDSVKLRIYDHELEMSAKMDEMSRRLLTLSILACSNFQKGQGGNTLAFRLAGCPDVLSP